VEHQGDQKSNDAAVLLCAKTSTNVHYTRRCSGNFSILSNKHESAQYFTDIKQSDIMHRKKLAKMSAALKMIELLDMAGELDDQLIPVGKS
jgi:hypothetical protein